MDILDLLDNLEETLRAGTPLPFTSRLLIDEQQALDIIDQIRVAIPEDMKQARRLVAERDSIIAEANQEAERLLRDAEARLQERVSDHAVIRDAEERAEEVRLESLRAAQQMRREADTYALSSLSKLHAQLHALADQVEQGMRTLERELDSSDGWSAGRDSA
jgi:hypothetical protein